MATCTDEASWTQYLSRFPSVHVREFSRPITRQEIQSPQGSQRHSSCFSQSGPIVCLTNSSYAKRHTVCVEKKVWGRCRSPQTLPASSEIGSYGRASTEQRNARNRRKIFWKFKKRGFRSVDESWRRDSEEILSERQQYLLSVPAENVRQR